MDFNQFILSKAAKDYNNKYNLIFSNGHKFNLCCSQLQAAMKNETRRRTYEYLS